MCHKFVPLPSSWGQHGAHLGPAGPRWAPCWPHEPCYRGCVTKGSGGWWFSQTPVRNQTLFSLPSEVWNCVVSRVYDGRFYAVGKSNPYSIDISISRWIRLQYLQLIYGYSHINFNKCGNVFLSTSLVIIQNMAIYLNNICFLYTSFSFSISMCDISVDLWLLLETWLTITRHFLLCYMKTRNLSAITRCGTHFANTAIYLWHITEQSIFTISHNTSLIP